MVLTYIITSHCDVLMIMTYVIPSYGYTLITLSFTRLKAMLFLSQGNTLIIQNYSISVLLKLCLQYSQLHFTFVRLHPRDDNLYDAILRLCPHDSYSDYIILKLCPSESSL